MRFFMAACAVSMLVLAACRTASVEDDLAALSGAAARGARDTLTNAQSRQLLATLVDTLIARAASIATRQSAALRDTLLGAQSRALLVELEGALAADLERNAAVLRDTILGTRSRVLITELERALLSEATGTAMRLRNDLLGPRTAALVGHLRDTLLGDATAARLAGLRDRLLDDSTLARVAALRDVLIGNGTQTAIDSIVARSLARVQAAATTQRQGVAGNVMALLWTAGGIVAILLMLAAHLFARKRQFQKMLGVVTGQIHRFPDRKAYDDLTNRIQDQSIEMGLEPQLRRFLARQDMLGEEAWMAHKR
ncbi:MAG TPA: hypothetical protein VHI13_17310 [Candidatus Kapabacteria bacterium]|nr:hypothetical protein [Candidatus Kapabacteria bacterium]